MALTAQRQHVADEWKLRSSEDWDDYFVENPMDAIRFCRGMASTG